MFALGPQKTTVVLTHDTKEWVKSNVSSASHLFSSGPQDELIKSNMKMTPSKCEILPGEAEQLI